MFNFKMLSKQILKINMILSSHYLPVPVIVQLYGLIIIAQMCQLETCLFRASRSSGKHCRLNLDQSHITMR